MPAASTKPTGVPLSKRAFAGLPATVDVASRSFEIVIATETPVRTWVPDPRVTDPETQDCSFIEVDEVLVAAGMDFSRVRGMPLLDNHNTYSGLGSQIGRVDNVRVDGPMILGTAVLANKDAHLITDIAEGFFGQVSAGYAHLEAELIERTDDVPLLQVNRWTLHEASLVPVGADPNAFVRGQRTFTRPDVKVRALETKPEEKSMDLEKLVTDAEDAIMAADAAVKAVVEASDDGAAEEVVERAKAVRKRADAATEEKTEEGAEGTRAEGDEYTEEETKEVEAARSLARGLGLLKIVETGVGMRAKPADIRSKLRSVYFGKDSTVQVQVQPKQVDTTQPTQLQSARSLYANKFNKRA